jgi:hypothetical protein
VRQKKCNRSKKRHQHSNNKIRKAVKFKYRMTVDGMQGTEGKLFNNINLLAKDSLYIFIETTANI